jgi:hypothetical protein
MIGYLAFAGVDWLPGNERAQLLPTVVAGPPTAFSLPRVPDEHRRRLGEDVVRVYEQGGIIAKSEHELEKELGSELSFCRVALPLVVPRAAVESLLVVWDKDNDDDVIRRIKPLPWWGAGFGDGGWFVDPRLWGQAARWVKVIISDWKGKHVHMAHALQSFEHACERREYDDRYELFCRSIETVLQTEMGQGAQQFAEGVRLVLSKRDELPSVGSLENHYRRRNEIVHGHRFLDREMDGEKVVLEMEDLARGFMQRLLADQGMFEEVMRLQQERVAARQRKAEKKKGQGTKAKRPLKKAGN